MDTKHLFKINNNKSYSPKYCRGNLCKITFNL